MTHSAPLIPADVPLSFHTLYCKRYATITRGTDRLFLFVYDHIIEHRNQELWSKQYSSHIVPPDYPFMIAQAGHIGAFAAPPALIARYGCKYPQLHYFAKLTGKTGLVPEEPFSTPLATVEEVIALTTHSSLSICGIGVTIYLGSMYESSMLEFAAHSFAKARSYGLLTCAWMYPRGAYIDHPNSPSLLAGAVSVAHALGADFVKIHIPSEPVDNELSLTLHDIVKAAGSTKVLCAGEDIVPTNTLLQHVYQQLYESGTGGCAIGRNIFLRPLDQAIALTQAIEAVVYNKTSVADAQKCIEETK